MPVPWGPIADCQYLIATTVTASDGAAGQGFSWAVQAGAQAIQAMVDADCGPAATGGPVAPAAAWDRMWWRLRESGGGITTLAMAAIDIGLWDLQAKAAGLGLTDLIGRQRETTQVYASGVNRHLSLDELTEQVQPLGRGRAHRRSRSRSACPAWTRTSSGSRPCAGSSARPGG